MQQPLLRAVEFVTREVLRGDRLGMRMAGSALPDRVRRILTGMPAARSSRLRTFITCLLAAAAVSLLATGTLARAQRVKVVRAAPQVETAVSVAPKASEEATPVSPVLLAQAALSAKSDVPAVKPAATPPAASEDLRFEVASLKASGAPPAATNGMPQYMAERPQTKGGPGTETPERITITQTPLRMLLWDAFGVHPDQISGPGWLDTAKFDITAKVPPGATKEQGAMMLRNLLIERFKITFHHTPQLNTRAYQVTVAKNGSKLKEVEPIPRPPQPSRRTYREIAALLQQPPLDADGFPIISEGQAGLRSAQSNGLHRITCRACSIEELVRPMTENLAVEILPGIAMAAAEVVDNTGLTGAYDFRLEYSSGNGAGGALQPLSFEPSSGPDLFTAFEKQLGLKFEKAKVMHDVVVIDQIEKVPTEN